MPSVFTTSQTGCMSRYDSIILESGHLILLMCIMCNDPPCYRDLHKEIVLR